MSTPTSDHSAARQSVARRLTVSPVNGYTKWNWQSLIHKYRMGDIINFPRSTLYAFLQAHQSRLNGRTLKPWQAFSVSAESTPGRVVNSVEHGKKKSVSPVFFQRWKESSKEEPHNLWNMCVLFNEFEQPTTADLLFHLTRQSDSLTTVSIFFLKKGNCLFYWRQILFLFYLSC